MQITSVEKNKINKDRMSVFLGGSYAFSVSEEDYIMLNLYEEKELSAEDIEYIKEFVNKRSAKALAIRYLSLKLRTGREVEDKLCQEGYDADTIEKVLAELMEMGYINDRIYAQKYVLSRSKLKPKSKKMLKLELQSKGISTGDIDEILNNWELDEDLVAEKLLRKRFGKYDLNDDKTRKKAYTFLQHRGFSFEQIDTAIARVSDEENI